MADEFKHLSAGTSLTQAEYEAVGGHVFACQATGDIVYASSGSQLSRLGKGAANTILAMGGSCVPAWTDSHSVTDLTIGGGCITLSAATDIDLLDDNASALSFDASGKTGIIDIVTTNCSEGVTMSGTLGVTGVVTASAEIELGHASDTTLARASSGEVNIEGNRIYRAGGTDVALADGGTGASLSDPGADRLLFWDDGSCAVAFLTAGSGLTICGTTMTASGGSITALNSNADNRIAFFGSTTTELDGDADLTWDGDTLIVRGEAGAPATSGSSVNATARINPTGITGTLDFGFLADSCGHAWMQSTCTGNHATNYMLWLNKNGGQVKLSESSTCGVPTFRANSQQTFQNCTSCNSKNSAGLTIQQLGEDNESLSLKSSDVTHGMTDRTETNTYFKISKSNAGQGGAILDAVTDNCTRSLIVRGSADTCGNTTTNRSAGYGVVDI